MADDVTYAEVGATCSEVLPTGYDHVRTATLIGRGARNFRTAGEALMTWQVQRRSGLKVRGSERVALGEVVWMGAVAGPLKAGFRCKVVSVTDEERRKGFAYGTLPGHPESGEEAFLLLWREDDFVELQIVAFSRPARWWSKVAGPAGRLVQRWMTGRYLKALS
ncbi:MAG: hypothetical protein QOJ11_1570 [Frankiales bacterium]|jgi:uncharacterized protein (UPF0548 family)|nr:hypothetical protein [Frankiales bacterium]